MDQRQLLEEYERYQGEAKTLIAARRDPVRARFALLKAAELLHQAAQNTSDQRLAATRREQAARLVEMAERIAEQADSWLGDAPTSNDPRAKPIPTATSAGANGSAHGFTCLTRPTLRFDDIAGLGELKSTLRRRVLDPLQHPDLARQYGISPGVGLLLYGPPGTGKTMLAQALAGEVGAPFYVIKPSDILVRYVGDSEQRLQALFAEARSHPLSVIFIDEIDALAPSRERAADSSGVMARLVPQILQELDGAGSRGSNPVLLVGATNEPWSLDPALLRPGRFDLRVLVDLPDTPALAELISLHLNDLPHSGIDPSREAQLLTGWSGADVKSLIEAARVIPFSEAIAGAEPRPISTADLAVAARRITPSVSTAIRERYRRWGTTPAPQASASQAPLTIEPPAAAPPVTASPPPPALEPAIPSQRPADQQPKQTASNNDDRDDSATSPPPWLAPASGPFAQRAPIYHPAIRNLLADQAAQREDLTPAISPSRDSICTALRAEGIAIDNDAEVHIRAAAATLRVAIPGAKAPSAASVTALAERLLTAHRIRLVSVTPTAGALIIAIARAPRDIPHWSWLALRDMDRPVHTPLIGPDEDGGPSVCLDLLEGDPHCLIAGSTGGGKSVLLRSLVMDLALRGSLNHLRLILMDPKRLDLAPLGRLPHLAMPPITEAQDALACFDQLIVEMERRYRILAQAGVTSLAEYHSLTQQVESLPRIVACCDEFADWMLDDDFKAAASTAIARLGAKARAAGIHLILATQRPEARVVPTLLRANLTGRICLRVATSRESELVIDRPGGEKLLGKGHALTILGNHLRSVQVPWLPSDQLKALLDCMHQITSTEGEAPC